MSSKTDTRQLRQRSLVDQLANAVDTELDNLIDSINKELTAPLRLMPSSPADRVVTVESISVTNSETGRRHSTPPISNLLPAFTSGTVTFPSTSGGTVTVTPGDDVVLTLASGQFIKAGFSLDANGNIVVQFGTAGASEAAATVPPLVANSHPIGFVVLQNIAGTIQNIANANIVQYSGGGGGGSGSGDASSVTSRLWDKFQDSSYKQLTAVNFSADQDDHVDGASTGAFSLVSQSFEFSAAAQTLITSNLLSSEEFLTQEKDVSKASITVVWDEDKVDTSAAYAISRDGGVNWQTLLMERVGQASDVYEGEHNFTEEPSFSSLAAHATTDASYDLNASTQQKLAQSFIASSPSVLKQVTLFLTKTGVPLGNVFVAIHRNNAGVPGDILSESAAYPVNALSTGSNTINIPATPVDATSTYWLVVRTDSTYQASYSNGVTELSLHSNSASSGLFTNNGSSWSNSNDGLKYTISGRSLDLRLRITSTDSNKAVIGYGAFYEQESGILNGVKNVELHQFLSNTDNEDTFSLGFLPDPDLLKVYHVQTGQVYVYPSFAINGNDIIFPVNTFQQDVDQLVTLRFAQTEGSSFDNSDSNANQIADISPRLTSLDRPNIRASEGAGTTTLTILDNFWQIFNLSAARTCVLPSTGIVKGQRFRIENQGSTFALTVQSSNTNSLLVIDSKYETAEFIALQDAPTSSAHWRVNSKSNRVKSYVYVSESQGTNGRGTSNTTVHRFSSTPVTAGTAITYAETAAGGSTFTINESGMYSMTYTYRNDTTSADVYIKKNSTAASGDMESDVLACGTVTATLFVCLSATVWLDAGDIIRAVTDPVGVNNTGSRVGFRITKIQ